MTGIDKSFSQVEQAKKIINAVQGNATELPFEKSSFDICTMIMMIHQLDAKEREKAFEEILRVLKENGKLIIKTTSHEELERKFNSIYFPKVLKIDKERYPTIDKIHYELKNFRKIKDIHSSVKVKYDKKDLLKRLKFRRTSNLSLISDEELYSGIKKIEKIYEDNNTIEMNIENTFVIAEK